MKTMINLNKCFVQDSNLKLTALGKTKENNSFPLKQILSRISLSLPSDKQMTLGGEFAQRRH